MFGRVIDIQIRVKAQLLYRSIRLNYLRDYFNGEVEKYKNECK